MSIPEVDLQIQSLEIQKRNAEAKWTYEAEQDLKAVHDIDVNAPLQLLESPKRMTQAILDAKWAELEAEAEETEDFEERDRQWNAWLEAKGLKHFVQFQCHWGESGVLDAIEELCKIIDDPYQYNCFSDPETEAILLFLREPQ